jgi:DNA-binding NtrC family response regulator
MVHGIVHQSGGHISVSSRVGRGSTFEIYLPEATDNQSAARAPRGQEIASHGTETILLVEDDAGVRRLASTALRNYGYTVLEASDGIAAQALIHEYRDSLDLVITDVIMPGGLSGVRLADYVVRQRAQIKILYMSGYADNAIAHQDALDARRAFLQKPFTPATLARKVREVLDTLPSEETNDPER